MNKKEIKQAGRLVKNFFILLILFFIVDRALGKWLQYKYNNVAQGDIKTFAHSITNPTEDIFIYGSSRAMHGYDCSVFSNILGYSCFNNGRENSTILYHDLILNAMLKKHIPKIIILDFAPKELSWGESENSKNVLANMILPYAIRDTAFANIARQQFPKELIKAKLSWLYAYKSSVVPLLNVNNISGENEIDGYRPLTGSKVKDVPQHFSDREETPDSSAERAFDAFVKIVIEKNIRLYVIQSPIYVKQYKSSSSLDYAKAVLKKYNIPFWDYAFDTALYKHEYFYDYIHLNRTGAALFSEEIAERIKKENELLNIHLH